MILNFRKLAAMAILLAAGETSSEGATALRITVPIEGIGTEFSWGFDARTANIQKVYEKVFSLPSLAAIIANDSRFSQVNIRVFDGIGGVSARFGMSEIGYFISGPLSAGQSVVIDRTVTSFFSYGPDQGAPGSSSATYTVVCQSVTPCSPSSGQMIAVGGTQLPMPTGPFTQDGFAASSLTLRYEITTNTVGPVAFAANTSFSGFLDYTINMIDPLESLRKLNAAKAANQARANAEVFKEIGRLDTIGSIASAVSKVAFEQTRKAAGELVAVLGHEGISAVPDLDAGNYQATVSSAKEFLLSISLEGVKSGGTYVAAAELFSNGLADYSARIAADPPDSNFLTFDTFVAISLTPDEKLRSGNPLLMEALIDQANFYLAARAALHAAERYQGALDAQDIAAASRQYDILQAALDAADEHAARSALSSRAIVDQPFKMYFSDYIADQETFEATLRSLENLDLSTFASLFDPDVSIEELKGHLDQAIAYGLTFPTDRDPSSAFAVLAASAGTEARAWLGAVPEPASWTMMILGFGLVGLALRQRYCALHCI